VRGFLCRCLAAASTAASASAAYNTASTRASLTVRAAAYVTHRVLRAIFPQLQHSAVCGANGQHSPVFEQHESPSWQQTEVENNGMSESRVESLSVEYHYRKFRNRGRKRIVGPQDPIDPRCVSRVFSQEVPPLWVEAGAGLLLTCAKGEQVVKGAWESVTYCDPGLGIKQASATVKQEGPCH
jgi:hypothetical protein